MEDFRSPFPNADGLLDRVMDICPFPATAQRLMALVDDDRSSLDTIGTAVACDPSLATQVLRVANSALFRKAGGEAVRDLRQALVVIGLQELRAMAGAMALLATFASPDEVSLDLQRASAISGSIAAAVMPRFVGAGRTLPFVCGLLAEVGALVCLVVDGPMYVDLWQQTVGARRVSPIEGARQREENEIRRYRAPSRSIGARLLRRHRLPEEIAGAIEAPSELGPSAPIAHRATAFARMATSVATAASAGAREIEANIAEIARSTSLGDLAPADLARRVVGAAAYAERALHSARTT
jgi:HD-like signal output (HDOD) protein